MEDLWRIMHNVQRDPATLGLFQIGDADASGNDNADDVEHHVLEVAESTTEEDVTDVGYPELASDFSDSSQSLDASARKNLSRWSLARSSGISSSN
ncbi:hypothetical protein PILCRDRAFT_823546 [Piloderma croceum F 1598]|uniref:Uncharacterized protein n=1 Tax=Piloderma croceum (strain F 1598) TaxID=765440 RepID=A0A0C3BPQ4_PILCF|nr:hypothetical protein PILCRDRAFT_823546 [Piloderma croceum F 1598]